PGKTKVEVTYFPDRMVLQGVGSINKAILNLDHNSKTIKMFSDTPISDTLQSQIHPYFPGTYFGITLYDASMSEKKSINAKGTDTAQNFINQLNNTVFSYGDIIKLEHREPGRAKVYDEGKEVNITNKEIRYFELTPEGFVEITLPAPKVNNVTDQDTKVTGTGEKGTTVKVVVDGKEIGTGKVDNQGNYAVDIPKQPGGKEVVVTLTDMTGNTSQPGKTKVESKDVTAPEVPKVNKVTDQDTKVTGTGEKGATVKVTVDGKEIGTGKVDDQGNYTVDIPKQPGGKEVVVTVTDTAGNTSQPGKTKVESKDVTAPEAPKVNKVTDRDTKVTGTGEKGATVKVTVDGKEIGTGKVDNQGNYAVDIPKQPGGKEVVVTLTDEAGNISKPTKTTVQEDPAIEDAKVKGAKQAIDDILTDLIQTNYSHDYSIVKQGAIQVHVAQQHITEAQE
ncbi:Ig-like domain-containing protein, partial [Bacillus toyonensis]